MDIFFIDYKNFSDTETEYIIKNFGESYKLPKRQKEYAFGRFLAKTVCEKFYAKSDSEIAIKNKKPYFINNPELHFSISHSKNLVLTAFGQNKTGADVEFMSERDFEKIFNYYNIKPEKFDKTTFYRFWTEYEAKIKLQTEPKSFLTLKILPDYLLSVVSEESFDIKAMLKIYELKSPTASTNPSELISRKLVNASSENENTVVIQEINTASLEFFEPLNLKTE